LTDWKSDSSHFTRHLISYPKHLELYGDFFPCRFPSKWHAEKKHLQLTMLLTLLLILFVPAWYELITLLSEAIRILEIECRQPRGVLCISSDGDDRRIFWGSKFSIPGFFWVEIWQVFFGGYSFKAAFTRQTNVGQLLTANSKLVCVNDKTTCWQTFGDK